MTETEGDEPGNNTASRLVSLSVQYLIALFKPQLSSSVATEKPIMHELEMDFWFNNTAFNWHIKIAWNFQP